MRDGRRKTYTAEGIAIHYEPRRCTHVAECVFGLPGTFDPSRRPWIDPDSASAEAIARVIERCPTGALHYDRRDGGPAEAPADVNRVRISRHGPLYLRGRIELVAEDGAVIGRDVRVALCRCGASENAPFCDNHHRQVGFVHGGGLGAGEMAPLPDGGAAAGDVLQVTVEANGPFVLKGPFELESADRGTRLAGVAVSLCRCGRSQNKPFCDGSHRGAEVTAP